MVGTVGMVVGTIYSSVVGMIVISATVVSDKLYSVVKESSVSGVVSVCDMLVVGLVVSSDFVVFVSFPQEPNARIAARTQTQTRL